MSGPTNYDSQGLEMFTEQRPAIVQLADLMDYINEMRDLYNETQSALQEVQSIHYFVSLKEFGAKGDGITDDSDALQQAIAEAKTQNKKLYVPSGVYAIYKNILIPSYSFIEGEDVQKSVFLFKSNHSFIFEGVTNSLGKYVYQIKLKNMSIDGNNISETLVKQEESANGVEECHFENVWGLHSKNMWNFTKLNLSNFLRCTSSLVDDVFNLTNSHHNNILYGNYYSSKNIFVLNNEVSHLNVAYAWFEDFENVCVIDHKENMSYGIDVGIINLDGCYCLSSQQTSKLMLIKNALNKPLNVKGFVFKNSSVIFPNKSNGFLVEMENENTDCLLYLKIKDNVVSISQGNKWFKSRTQFDFQSRLNIKNNIYSSNSVLSLDGNAILLGVDSNNETYPLNNVAKGGVLLENFVYENKGVLGFNDSSKQLNFFDGTERKSIPVSVPDIGTSTASSIDELKNDLNTVITVLRNAKLLK